MKLLPTLTLAAALAAATAAFGANIQITSSAEPLPLPEADGSFSKVSTTIGYSVRHIYYIISEAEFTTYTSAPSPAEAIYNAFVAGELGEACLYDEIKTSGYSDIYLKEIFWYHDDASGQDVNYDKYYGNGENACFAAIYTYTDTNTGAFYYIAQPTNIVTLTDQEHEANPFAHKRITNIAIAGGRWEVIAPTPHYDKSLPINLVIGWFDGDNKADIGVFGDGTWIIEGSDSGSYSTTFGSGDCIPVPADYDGDGTTDFSVYDTVTGDWWIRYSGGGWTKDNFGSLTCKPFPADYDGDGKADLSVWDGRTGDWWIRYSSGGWKQDNFGSLSCIPVPADYDGDGKADLSVRDNATGDWWTRYSSGNGPNGMPWSGDNFGSTVCDPYPADYDGDRLADLSVYDQETGDWFVRFSLGGWTKDNFGMKTCIPCPADYDGDGKADFAVFDTATSTFWVRYSGGGWTSVVF